MAAFQLKDTQRVQLNILVEDAAGNVVPAPTDWPAPIWDKADTNNAVTVTASDTPYSVWVSANGPLGLAQVQITGGPNADLRGLFDVEVIASAATQIVVNPGTPEDKPTAAPAPAPAPAPAAP